MSQKNNKKKNYTNKLNFKTLTGEVRKATKSKKHFITSPVTGNKFVIWVDTLFLPSKKDKVINNTLNFLNTNLFRKLQNDQIVEFMFYINMICEFTSFGRDVPNDYESKLQALNYLADIELFDTILDLFPLEELEKLAQELNDRTAELQDALEELPEQLEEAREQVEDDVLREEIDRALKVLTDGEEA